MAEYEEKTEEDKKSSKGFTTTTLLLAAIALICGIGIGLFQTPNNVTITTSAPIQRSGGASGMLGTARVLGQTLGTAMVAVLFHLVGNQGGGEVVCLWVALGLALVSGILSASRLKEDSPLQKKA